MANAADTFSLADGGSVTGDIVKPDDSGIMIHTPAEVYTNIAWARFSQDTLKQLSDFKPPVFYMNYTLNPQANPWRDAIGAAVKSMKGAEFTISRPRDLFFAWTEIIGRIVKLKVGRNATAAVAPAH